jgi:hypothetical protein
MSPGLRRDGRDYFLRDQGAEARRRHTIANTAVAVEKDG